MDLDGGRCQKLCLFTLEITLKTRSLTGKDSKYQKIVYLPGVCRQKRMNKISPRLVPNSVASIASLLLTVKFYPKAETNLFCSVFFLKNRYDSLSFQILKFGQNVSQ